MCENVLIRGHQQLLWDEFQALLDSEKPDGTLSSSHVCKTHAVSVDLFRIYTLLSRIPEGLDPLRKTFETHVKRTGLAAVEKVAGEAGDSLVRPYDSCPVSTLTLCE